MCGPSTIVPYVHDLNSNPMKYQRKHLNTIEEYDTTNCKEPNDYFCMTPKFYKAHGFLRFFFVDQNHSNNSKSATHIKVRDCYLIVNKNENFFQFFNFCDR